MVAKRRCLIEFFDQAFTNAYLDFMPSLSWLLHEGKKMLFWRLHLLSIEFFFWNQFPQVLNSVEMFLVSLIYEADSIRIKLSVYTLPCVIFCVRSLVHCSGRWYEVKAYCFLADRTPVALTPDYGERRVRYADGVVDKSNGLYITVREGGYPQPHFGCYRVQCWEVVMRTLHSRTPVLILCLFL